MGPSGSGKTTLLNVISTLDKATEGIITIAGTDITKMKGNEDKSQHPTTKEYKLDAYNEEGEKAKVTFTVSEELKNPTFLRIRVLKSKDPDENHFVKNYETVKETELPEKVKEKIKGN